MENQIIASIFNQIADLLDIQGENPFRIRSYRAAARMIEDLPENLASTRSDGKDLTELPGIGRELSEKIDEIIKTGKLGFLDELKAKLPPDCRNSSDWKVSARKRSSSSTKTPASIR